MVIATLFITAAVVCKADNAVCAEDETLYYSARFYNILFVNNINKVVDKLVQDIDREVGSGCMTNRKFIENSGNVWGDVEAMGACRTEEGKSGSGGLATPKGHMLAR